MKRLKQIQRLKQILRKKRHQNKHINVISLVDTHIDRFLLNREIRHKKDWSSK